MFSVTFAEWTKPPLVPVTVRVLVPLTAFLFVLTVIVEVPLPVTDDGLNLAFANFGKPVTEKLTAPEKPAVPEIVTVKFVSPG
jgi:hypothetical protein